MPTNSKAGPASRTKVSRAASPSKKAGAPSPKAEAPPRKSGAPKVADKPVPPRAKRGDPKIPGTTQYAADPLVDPKYTPVTDLVLESFFHLLALTGNITRVCDHLRLNRIYMLDLKRRDPEVAKRWGEAMAHAADGWEAEVARRAFEGYDRPVYQGGVLVGTERMYSDRLAEMMVKAARPEKYVPKTVQTIEHAGVIGHRHASMTNEELNKTIHEQMHMLAVLEVARTGPKTTGSTKAGDDDAR